VTSRKIKSLQRAAETKRWIHRANGRDEIRDWAAKVGLEIKPWQAELVDRMWTLR